MRPTPLYPSVSAVSSLLLAACMLLSAHGGLAAAEPVADEVELTLLQSSDVHAHVFPYDYFAGEEAELGFAKLATLVEQVRQERPGALLLDAGDTIQGTPLVYYHYRVEPADENPVVTAMNRMGYDAMTVGNHEFNFGLQILDRARDQAQFPWLSANILTADGQPRFSAYAVFEREGVRVGVLGLTTKNIPNWEKPEHIGGLRFEDTVEAARRWVPILRERERCDVVVVLTHQGFERDLETGEAGENDSENQAYRLATEVPGVDLVLAGHAHQDIEPRLVGDVLVSMPHRHGTRLTRVDLRLRRGPDGRFALVEKSGRNLSVEGVAPHAGVLDAVRPFHERTLAYIGTPIGTLTAPMDGSRARLEDSAMMDLLQRAQMHFTGAELSLASMLPRRSPRFEAGPITIRDVYSFYVYDNSLYAIEVTGQQIKDALEVAARYYEDATLGPDGRLQIRTSRSVASFNFDMLAGADYQIDPTRPSGERILNLTFQGQPMDLARTYLLAVNNYRAAGSAGYTMFQDAPRRYVSSEEIRELLIQYIREKKQIEPHCDQNWFVGPVPVFAQEAKP